MITKLCWPYSVNYLRRKNSFRDHGLTWLDFLRSCAFGHWWGVMIVLLSGIAHRAAGLRNCRQGRRYRRWKPIDAKTIFTPKYFGQTDIAGAVQAMSQAAASAGAGRGEMPGRPSLAWHFAFVVATHAA
jgi:hypothetical protein